MEPAVHIFDTLTQDQRDTVMNFTATAHKCKGNAPESSFCSDANTIIKIADTVVNFTKGRDIMEAAVLSNHVMCLDMFLQNTVISQNINMLELLDLACENGCTNIVKLLASKIDLYPKPEKYVSTAVTLTPLSVASAKGYSDIVRFLLIGTDAPHVKYIKEHAFKEALKVPHLPVVELFVESYKQSSTKIDTNILEYIKPKALSVLFRKSSILDVLDLADTKHASYFFGEKLIRFASDGEYMGVRFLLDDPRIKLAQGNSAQLKALVGAAECGRDDIISLLVSRGTNPYACLDDGYSCSDEDKYYVFVQLLSWSSKCEPSVIMDIFKRAPVPYTYGYMENPKRDVLLLLMANNKMHESIVDRLILKEDRDTDSDQSDSDKNDRDKNDDVNDA